MAGKILGVYKQDLKHLCDYPIKLFKRTYTVWECDCGKTYRLEWDQNHYDSYRYWEPYKIFGDQKRSS